MRERCTCKKCKHYTRETFLSDSRKAETKELNLIIKGDALRFRWCYYFIGEKLDTEGRAVSEFTQV